MATRRKRGKRRCEHGVNRVTGECLMHPRRVPARRASPRKKKRKSRKTLSTRGSALFDDIVKFISGTRRFKCGTAARAQRTANIQSFLDAEYAVASGRALNATQQKRRLAHLTRTRDIFNQKVVTPCGGSYAFGMARTSRTDPFSEVPKLLAERRRTHDPFSEIDKLIAQRRAEGAVDPLDQTEQKRRAAAQRALERMTQARGQQLERQRDAAAAQRLVAPGQPLPDVFAQRDLLVGARAAAAAQYRAEQALQPLPTNLRKSEPPSRSKKRQGGKESA